MDQSTPQVTLKETKEGWKFCFTGSPQAATKLCNEIFGLYDPLMDSIFINPLIQGDEYQQALLHEIVHSYQFRYRFPLDVNLLLKMASLQDGHGHAVINRSEIIRYLRYYYETQAHYYAISAFQSPVWRNSVTRKMTHRLGSAWATIEGTTGLYMLTHLPSFISAIHRDGILMKRLRDPNFFLPVFDYEMENSDIFLRRGTELTEWIFSQRELIVQNKAFDSTTIGFINSPMLLHFGLAKTIESTYFGALPFAFHPKYLDQRVYVTLHNHFFREILLGDGFCDVWCSLNRYQLAGQPLNDSGWIGIRPIHDDQIEKYDRSACRELIESQPDLPPLKKWASVPTETFQRCIFTHDLNVEAFRSIIRELTETGELWEGTEGSTPGLRLLPQLAIKPH